MIIYAFYLLREMMHSSDFKNDFQEIINHYCRKKFDLNLKTVHVHKSGFMNKELNVHVF